MNAVAPFIRSNLHPRRNVRNEMGLSDGYAEAMGELVGDLAARQPASSCGVLLVTHSRPLARGLLRTFGSEPTMLSLGAPATSAAEWIESREVRSVDDLRNLGSISLERFRAAHRTLGI